VQDFLDDLRATVAAESIRLMAMSDELASVPPSTGKWTPKEAVEDATKLETFLEKRRATETETELKTALEYTLGSLRKSIEKAAKGADAVYLATDLDRGKLQTMTNEIQLPGVLVAAPAILDGRIRGRIVVKIG